MKITRRRLKEIIKEEVTRHATRTVNEDPSDETFHDETFSIFEKVVATYGGDYYDAAVAVIMKLPQDVVQEVMYDILRSRAGFLSRPAEE